MKSSELRIGNLIQIANPHTLRPKGGDHGYIHALNTQDCVVHWDRELFVCSYRNMFEAKAPYIKSLSLTSEWLGRFGFKKPRDFEEDPFYYLDNWDIVLYANKDGKYTCNSNSAYYTLCWIEHVHQLQNLYFALTGEELTIK